MRLKSTFYHFFFLEINKYVVFMKFVFVASLESQCRDVCVEKFTLYFYIDKKYLIEKWL